MGCAQRLHLLNGANIINIIVIRSVSIHEWVNELLKLITAQYLLRNIGLLLNNSYSTRFKSFSCKNNFLCYSLVVLNNRVCIYNKNT